MYTFVIEGIPIPWSAHQGYGRKSFNPKYKEREYARWKLKAHFNQEKPITGAIAVTLSFYMPVPKGSSKVRTRAMLEGKMHHIKRPDVDNLSKFMCDCLKTIVFEDDSQIVELHSKKLFAENPKTVIVINKLSD